MRKTIQISGVSSCGYVVVEGGVVVEATPKLRHYVGCSEARAHELVRQKRMSWVELAIADKKDGKSIN